MVAFYDLPRCTPPQPGHDGEESQRGLFGGFYQKSTTRTTRRSDCRASSRRTPRPLHARRAGGGRTSCRRSRPRRGCVGGERTLTPAAADTAKDDAWNDDKAVWLSAKGPWNNDAFEGAAEAEPAAVGPTLV